MYTEKLSKTKEKSPSRCLKRILHSHKEGRPNIAGRPFVLSGRGKMSRLTAVFDVDDTICNNRNRDYANAEPYTDVIEKINGLKERGYEIILHTSRGMVSCGGDVEKADKKNRQTLEKWLHDNNVHYDKLLFGKPIADLYVDDKGYGLDDFMREDFRELHGGSGLRVDRIGRIVRKDLGSEENTLRYQKWLKSNDVYRHPVVHSFKYNEIYMDYIDGMTLYNSYNRRDITRILRAVDKARQEKREYFDMEKQIAVLEKNRTEETAHMIDATEKALREIELEPTFCHGDLTLGNIIKDGYNRLYYIDPVYDEEASSYVLDCAKLRMSLDGYENHFGMTEQLPRKKLREILDRYTKQRNIYRETIICEVMYILRLYRYKKGNDKPKALRFAEIVAEENEELFS